MADILLDAQSAPSNPASGQGIVYPDATAAKLVYVDDAGRKWGFHRRHAVADQAPAANTDTYITNSGLLIPSFGLQVGTHLRWELALSKTAAGTAAAVVRLRFGTNQTTADTERLAITLGAQSAVADQGIMIIKYTVRTVSATGVIRGDIHVAGHHAAAVGLGNGAGGTSAGFDNSALQGQFAGLSLNTGASAAWTITQCVGEIEY